MLISNLDRIFRYLYGSGIFIFFVSWFLEIYFDLNSEIKIWMLVTCMVLSLFTLVIDKLNEKRIKLFNQKIILHLIASVGIVLIYILVSE